jgi:hypothetical protein
MRFRVLVLACATMVGSFTGAIARDPTVLTPAQTKALVEKTNRQSMVFFVAKGEANACGPGCSEWIAAEGAVDVQAGKRFQEFVEKLSRRDLPVYFNSIGGQTQQASLIALVLRTNRMRAGVARAVPDGCGADVASDAACRRLVQSKTEIRARLVTKGSKCSSACGVAFAGGSFRQVATDAQFGIHSFATTKKTEVDEWNAGHKRFFIALGVDSGVIDLINTIPFNRMRPMSRDEMARVGLETRGFFQTQWAIDKDSRKQSADQYTLRKSVTQPEPAESGNYYTTRIIIGCPNERGLPFVYRRELSKGEGRARAVVRLGDQDLTLQSYFADMKDTEALIVRASADQLRKAAVKPMIEVAEELSLQGGPKPRVTGLSTAGFSDALERLLRLCEANSMPQPPPQATVTVPTPTLVPVHAAARDETPWTLHTDPAQQFSEKFSLRKSITRVEASGGPKQHRIEIAISCPDWWGLPLTYRRELSKNEDRVEASIRLNDRDLAMQSPRHTANSEKDIELKSVSTSIDLLRGAAEKPSIEISEKLRLQGELKLHVTSFSTVELAVKLDELLRFCDASKRPYVHSPPAQAIAR